jgi:hypothetical protein
MAQNIWLVVGPERLGIDPARVAQGGDEQEHHARLASLHRGPALAEVDPQLTARRCFEELCWNLGDGVIRRRFVLAYW